MMQPTSQTLSEHMPGPNRGGIGPRPERDRLDDSLPHELLQDELLQDELLQTDPTHEHRSQRIEVRASSSA